MAAAAGVTFTVAFSVVVREGDRWAKWVSAVALAGDGLLTLPVLVALYALLREREPEFAFLGVLLGTVYWRPPPTARSTWPACRRASSPI